MRGIAFEVARGEVYGFLGPNGAGKSTTLKMITGLVAPTSGSASLFGAPLSHDSLRKVGFLPESPYVHPHLSPREFVTLCARLSDLREPHARVADALARTGVTDAIDRPARTLSKGTLQRVALAAALVHGPELLILDEPMGGLDPAGRKQVRDRVLEEKAKGNSVLLSSHVLSDVELLCDRVCILREGSVAFEGPLAGVLDETFRTEITLIENQKTDIIIAIGEAEIADVLERALARGARVVSVTPKRETLEELFVRRAL